MAALVCGATALPAAAAILPSGFTETLVASGLASPTAMAFAPDGRLFICEQGGRVRVVKNGSLLPSPFVALPVHSAGERGLLGVAFDPDFTSNQYVYVYYTATSPTYHNRISRFTASGDVAAAGSELVLLDLDPLSGALNHNGGALHFGPDGMLYAAVGDNANGVNAQSLANLHGKILRLNRNGSIPTDNPFYSVAAGKNRAIWALGLRNPFTFSIDPVTSAMFVNDVGEGEWEEVNEAAAGANFGWPDTEGFTSDSRFQSPRYAYPHTGGACAIVGGTFYAASQFPVEYTGAYFFADYCAGWIRKLDAGSGPGTAAGFAAGISSPVDLAASPDGGLYYLARGSSGSSGVVYRIEYGGGESPAISTQPASQTVTLGGSVTFSVRASGTPPLSYQWQRNGANISGANAADYTIPSTAASDDGVRLRVVVSNNAGSVTSAEAVLTVTSNQRPTANILLPAEGTLYSGGQEIWCEGEGTDPEDGTLPADAFTWQVDFHHDTHNHPFIAPTTGVKAGWITIPTTGETSSNVWYRLTLTVTDSDGLTHTTFRNIMPRKSLLTLQTSPPGLQLKLDGQPVATPLAFDSVVGMVRSLEAASPQSLDGGTWTFDSWSDGGQIAHEISTPPSATTYVANFSSVSSGTGHTILAARFDSSDEGFVYMDDPFRGSARPGYASGLRLSSAGFSGGALKVTLGGIDDEVISGMSGGWRHSVTLPVAAVISLSFRYKLTQSANYEHDEFSEVVVRVDGLQPGTGGNDYVARIAGDGNGGEEMTTAWQLFEVSLGQLEAGTHTLTIGGYNNRKTFNDETTEILVDDVVLTSGEAVSTSATDALEAHFDTGHDGFEYSADAFRGSAQPGYASGTLAPSSGFSGGALKLTLGGIDDAVVSGMSAGWRRSFTLSQPAAVTLALRYNLTHASNYEEDEFSEVLVAVGSLQPGVDGSDYVARLAGDGNGGEMTTTGWQAFEVDLGTLPAGTHTLTVGGYNNKKTFNDEVTEILIDDVMVIVR